MIDIKLKTIYLYLLYDVILNDKEDLGVKYRAMHLMRKLRR